MLVCRANDSDNPNWTVEDSTDLNYGLRVLEGWMKQAHVYIEGNNYAYAHIFASSIVLSGANYSDWYIADYPKQATRMKKLCVMALRWQWRHCHTTHPTGEKPL